VKRTPSTLFAAALAIVASLSALFSCNAVLGIQSDRKVDTSYPDGGYKGCSGGNDCNSCTSELHRCLCAGDDSASCGSTGKPQNQCEDIDDDCMTCGCEDCGDDYQKCMGNPGCKEILGCIEGHACDLDASSSQSCYLAASCGGVIDANGGPDGQAKKLLDTLVACSIEADCPCKRRACTKEYDCQACSDCMATCQCQGKDDATCQRQCQEQACSPDNDCVGCKDCMATCKCRGQDDSACKTQCATPCSEEDACAGCTDCISQCVCQGQTESECQTKCTCSLQYDNCTGCLDCIALCQCNGDTESDCEASCATVSTCSSKTGCTDCPGCFEQCRCTGGTVASCTRDCATPRNDNCTAGGSCTGCGTCTTKCTCKGGLPKTCANDCGLNVCPTDCDSCATCMDTCECNGFGGATCIEQCMGGTCEALELPSCDDCACKACPEVFGRCAEDTGCQEIARCMQETDCRGAPCFTAATCLDTVDLWGGISGRPAALAEQLLQCRDAAACDCGGNGGTVACGNLVCSSWTAVSPQPNVPACCPPTPEEDCGLDVSNYLSGGCVPLGEPGYVDSACPELKGPPAPYPSEITLRGCCRPDNVCGFYDDAWLGLGCVKPELLNKASTTGCTYELPAPGL
jgi:hypothetical protein